MYEKINTPELFRRVSDGDREAFDTAVLANMGLVKSIARHFLDRGTDFDDLVQIGSIGLMKAVRNFDITAGTRFSTYAVPLITGEIKKHLRDDGIIKVSRELKRDAATVARARQEYLQKHGGEPRLSELATACGLTEDAVSQACEASSPVLSFSAGEDGPALENAFGEDNIAASFEKISLRQALTHLSHTERELVLNRFFLGKSQKETGDILGMTQVTVSRREKAIIIKLRNELL